MRRNASKRGGFALVAALLMITMVVTATVALINLVAADVTRTRDEFDGAQARQLLLVGAAVARERAEDSTALVNVALPLTLSENARVEIATTTRDDLRTARVRVTGFDRRVEETYRFRKIDDRWTAIGVTTE